MKAVLRSAAWRILPGVMAERARHYERGLRRLVGVSALTERFVAAHGSIVLHGPFAGVVYPQALIQDSADAPIAKLLGTYEEELHPIIAEVLAAPPPRHR